MIWLWVVLGVIGVIVLMLPVMYVVGSRMAPGHVASATLRLNQTPDAVWSVVADPMSYPRWSGVTKVEQLPTRDGRPTWRQWMGRNSFVLETTQFEPPRRMRHTIADDAKFFGGSWEYAIDPAPGGCTVTITERGEVYAAIPRFLMHCFFDPAMYLKKYLRALATKFGETPRLEEARSAT